VIYLSGVHSEAIAAYAANEPALGLMAQPRSATVQHAGMYRHHAYDNGAFGAWLRGEPFDVPGWCRQLQRLAAQGTSGLLFAAAPDVVGDHASTLAAWDEHIHAVLAAGLPPAFVLQNGCVDLEQVPLAARAVFVGGDDTYKLGPDAARVCWQARAAGLWVHMGRVNSERRWLRALAMGCDSADGTFLRFGPPAHQLRRLQVWLDAGRDSGGQLDLLDHTGGMR
jgi:hypothetical protein